MSMLTLQRFNLKTIIAASTVGLATAWTIPARAQISLAPLVIETKAERGQAKGFFTVVNNSNEPFRARVYTSFYTFDKDKGFTIIPSGPSDLTPYLQFSPRELDVEAGATRKVRFNVVLPPSAEDGEYRTMIFTEPLKEIKQTDKNGSTVAVKTRIGVAVLVRKGDLAPILKVESAHWDAQSKSILILVSNSGKVSAYSEGTWILKQADKEIQSGDIKHTSVTREGSRNLLLSSKDPKAAAPPAPGSYQLSGTLSWKIDEQPGSLPFAVDIVIPTK
jgi:hypothetical protein